MPWYFHSTILSLLFCCFAQAEKVVQHEQTVVLGVNAIQLDTSVESAMSGTQVTTSFFLHERVEIINAATMLKRDNDSYNQNDFRLRLWGVPAGSWHPGLALELGHLYQSEDWLHKPGGTTVAEKNVSGYLVGGDVFRENDNLKYSGFIGGLTCAS